MSVSALCCNAWDEATLFTLLPAYWLDTLAYMPYVQSFFAVLFSSVQSPRLPVPLCCYKLCHPHTGPLASHTSSLFSPLIYSSIIKSFDPIKLETIVEITPRGFHTKAAKAAEGLKSVLMVQTFIEWDFLLLHSQHARERICFKSQSKNNDRIKNILLLLQLPATIPVSSISGPELLCHVFKCYI